MAITISESIERERFLSKHWIHSRTGDNKEQIIITGIVKVDFKGEGTAWKQETLDLYINFPPNIIPDGQALQVEQWAPFITISSIYNHEHAVNAGWAVDEFSGPGRILITTSMRLQAKVAVRDIDSWIYRLSYSLNLIGNFVEHRFEFR